ncbi:MAG: hypothetical protein JEY96_03945 [Bacteroidales bacterium]|nr:hypothetical protein [Bacteroidales bacterium]
MLQDKIESLIFQNKTKDQLIEETITSLNGLLTDIFTGDDINELKKEFPEGVQLEDISIQLEAVAIYVNSKEFDVPCVEFLIDLIQEKTQLELGSYSVIYDEKSVQVDEILNLF